VPTVGEGFDWDLGEPGSRFTDRPAFGLSLPEDWAERNAAVEGFPSVALSRYVGDWVLEEQEELGQGEAVDSSVGRGASGWAVALEFGRYALGGVISVSAGLAWKRFLERVGRERQDDGRPGFLVSRGGAAYLAAAEVAERFGEQGDLVVEAVEEPSSIAGHDVSELSYTGIEPWIVLLRRDETLRRYLVVVAPGGEIDGALETPMREYEPGYLLPPPNIVRPPRRRRRWRFWRRG
jgi:hypothetical protein